VRLALVLAVLGVCDAAGAYQPPVPVEEMGDGSPLRLYRVPFESVTRLFPPGTDLESIRYEEFVGLAKPVERTANETVSPASFLGSADHDIELKDGELRVISRFGSPAGKPDRGGFRILPPWLDPAAFADARLSIEAGSLFVAPDGRILLDARPASPVVRWSVSSPEDGPNRRFPVRFPAGIATRLRLKLPEDAVPESDQGEWIPDGAETGGFRRWNFAGPGTPIEIRVASRTGNGASGTDDFDADSSTEWSIDEDQWSGVWKATLRSPGPIDALEVMLAAEVIVAGCFVNDVETPFTRSGENLKFPIDASGGRPVSVRVEMRRLAVTLREVVWPSVRPLQGRWFLNRVQCDDARKFPFVEVVDSGNRQIPVALESVSDRGKLWRRLRFALDDPGRKLTLRVSGTAIETADQLIGELLVRNRSRFASMRLIVAAANEGRPARFVVRSAMKPIRVESYRMNTSGQRSPCDFEITKTETSFVIQALPSDTSRGTLTFDLQLAESVSGENQPQTSKFPAVESESGRPVVAKWTLVSDEPRMRLNVRSAEGVRWLPVAATGNRSALPGIERIAPQAKPLAAFSSESGTSPEMTAQRLADSATGSAGRMIRIFVGTNGNRQFRSITFETSGGVGSPVRELADKVLAQAVLNQIGEAEAGGFGQSATNAAALQSTEPGLVRYRMSSIAVADLPRELSELAQSSRDRSIEAIFVTEPRRFAESLIAPNRPDSSILPEIERLARASVDFLKANRLLADHFDLARCEIASVKRAEDLARIAQDLAEELKSLGPEPVDPPIWSEPVSLTTKVFKDGSARHRFLARIVPPRDGNFQVTAGPGCELSEIRLDGLGIPFELDQEGKAAKIQATAGADRRQLVIGFDTSPGAFSGSEFPLRVGLADVAVEWTIASDDDAWSLRDDRKGSQAAAISSPDGSQPFRTSFGNLGRIQLVRDDSRSSSASWARLVLTLMVWSVLFAAIDRFSWAAGSPVFARAGTAAMSFVALVTQPGLRFMIAAGLIMCLIAILLSRTRGFSHRGPQVALALFAAAFVPAVAAQVQGQQRPIVVALPYDSIGSVLAAPKRAILSTADLSRLRELAAANEKRVVIPAIVVGSARHVIEPGEAGAFRVTSKYRIESTLEPGSRAGDVAQSLPLPVDDALQVRAFLGQVELPVRVDRTAGNVEIRFDRPASGELTVRKTYPAVRPAADVLATVLPSVDARISRSAELDRQSPSDWAVSFGDRIHPITTGQDFPLDLVRNVRISSDTAKRSLENPAGIRAWFTAVRSSAGIYLYARIRDDGRSVRTLTFAEGIRFLDATDCESTILPPTSGGKSRIRILPGRVSYRVRLWIPLSRASDALGDILAFEPAQADHRSVVRLATSADVAGEWSVTSDAIDFQEDPFEQESAAAESDSMIRRTFEIADWRSLKWRFEPLTNAFEPQVEGLIAVEDKELIGRFGVSIPIPGGSPIIQECVVAFDPATVVTGVNGPGLVDDFPVENQPHARRIRYVCGPNGVARFSVRIRSSAKPALPGTTAESAAPLPWPRFATAPLVAGNLIVERRIDPESTFRTSPLRVENAPIDSLGEIRSPDTPADIRQWLYRFRGAAEPPLVGWQLPGVFCNVLVDHSVSVEGDRAKWVCQIRYEPRDGPLASMFFEVAHPDTFDIVVEADSPGDFQVDKTSDAGRTRFHVRSLTPAFGVASIRLRGESTVAPGGVFELPGVSPLGHGRVDKSVSFREPAPSAASLEVVTKGMTEQPSSPNGSRNAPQVRTWKIRAADAGFALRFAPAEATEPSGEIEQASPVADRTLTLRDLAAEAGDDGFVLWYATADVRTLRDLGIAWPESLGELQAFDREGIRIALVRREEQLLAVDPNVRNMTGGCLLTGRFRADRWAEWFATVIAKPVSRSGRPLHYALRDSRRFPERPQGTPATLAAWVMGRDTAGSSSSSNSSIDEARIQARLRRFRNAWYAEVSPGLSEPAIDGPKPLEAEPSSNRPVATRPAADDIDNRLIAEPGRWRFFRYDGSPAAPRSAFGALLSLNSGYLLDGFRKVLVALLMTFVAMRCGMPARTSATETGEMPV